MKAALTTAIARCKLAVHIISHNHWDREWIFTARYTNRLLAPFFAQVFKMLQEQPAYRFVLDGQILIIEDYLKQLPAEEAVERERQLRQYIRAGRLLVGPAYLQPDWGLVSGEALVRNLMIGCRMAQRLGGVMKVGWMLDNFGQIAQAPQIYRGFGIDGVFVWRGVGMAPEELKSEFWWESPDGSAVLAVYLINSYRNAMVLSLTREIAQERIISEANALRPFATTPNVLLMNGYEQVPWPDDVLPIIDQVNQATEGDMECKQSTPPEYLEAIRQHDPQLPTVRGYLYSGRYAPILKGVFSSRSQLKLLNNECQRELERWAEPFASLAWLLGIEYPKDRLETAWKTLLLNHAHDDMCGCSVDPVARDMEDRFDQVCRIASEIAEERLRNITNAINTTGVESLLALVVFNPSYRPRQDVIGVSVQLPAEIETFSIVDGAGRTAPYQLIRRAEGEAALYLYADNIPSLGYKTYYIVPGVRPSESPPAVIASEQERTLENVFVRVQLNDDGSLNLTDKQTGQVYLNLGYFEDGGDCGDTYDYSFPQQDRVITSLGQKASLTLEEHGPLLAKFRIELWLDLPVSLTQDRTARHLHTRRYPIVSYVELAANSRRVEVKTILNNVVKDHRLRVLFPTGIQAACSYAEEPFDVARWPVASEGDSAELPEQVQDLLLAGRYTVPVNTNPFQNFVDYVDTDKGVALISRRVTEYEVLNGGVIALTLLRSVGWLARYDLQTRVGDVGPHIFTPEAQCLGKHVFHYAIYPHGGAGVENTTQLEAMSHNLRPRVVQTSAQPGHLPDQLSFVSLTTRGPANAFRMTALKRAETGDGVIVRFYNTLAEPVEGELACWCEQVEGVFKTNLNEKEQEGWAASQGVVRVRARPKEIVTLKLKLRPRLLLDAHDSELTQVLPPLPPADKFPPVVVPPALTDEEVEAERARARALDAALTKAKAEVFTLEDEIERTASRDLARLIDSQKKKTEVSTLTRQLNEARISALINGQLYITKRMESDLEAIGEGMSWSRTKKRAGEFLLHYYSSLMDLRAGANEPE